MTTILVKPINASEPGSFRQRSKLFHAIAMLKTAKEPADMAAAYVALEDLAVARCETDDGSDVGAALDLLSADQFDQLMQSLAGESSVPTQSAGN